MTSITIPADIDTAWMWTLETSEVWKQKQKTRGWREGIVCRSWKVHLKYIRWWLHWWEWIGSSKIHCNDDALCPRSAAVYSPEPVVTAGEMDSCVSWLWNESRSPFHTARKRVWWAENTLSVTTLEEFLHKDKYWLDILKFVNEPLFLQVSDRTSPPPLSQTENPQCYNKDE